MMSGNARRPCAGQLGFTFLLLLALTILALSMLKYGKATPSSAEEAELLFRGEQI